MHLVTWQAEKLRSKAQRPEVSRSTHQLCRYLYYLGRIRAIQLEYTEAKDCLQQALRKVCFSTSMHLCCGTQIEHASRCMGCRRASLSIR